MIALAFFAGLVSGTTMGVFLLAAASRADDEYMTVRIPRAPSGEEKRAIQELLREVGGR